VSKARRIMGENAVRAFIAEGVCPVVDRLADLGFVIGLVFSAHEFDPAVSSLVHYYDERTKALRAK
jgi:hypothetical protein